MRGMRFADHFETKTGAGGGTPFDLSLTEFGDELRAYAATERPKGTADAFNHADAPNGGGSDPECTARNGDTLDYDGNADGSVDAGAFDRLLGELPPGFGFVGQQRPGGKFHLSISYATPIDAVPDQKLVFTALILLVQRAFAVLAGVDAFDAAPAKKFGALVYPYHRRPGDTADVVTVAREGAALDVVAFALALGFDPGAAVEPDRARTTSNEPPTVEGLSFEQVSALVTAAAARAAIVAPPADANYHRDDKLRDTTKLARATMELAGPRANEIDRDELRDAMTDFFGERPSANGAENMRKAIDSAIANAFRDGKPDEVERDARIREALFKNVRAPAPANDTSAAEPEAEEQPLVTAAAYFLSTKNDPPTELCKTGLPELDRRLGGGLKSGEQTGLVAPTNSGKTAKALQIAVHAARDGTPVVLFSSELTRRDNCIRLAALASGGQITIPGVQFGMTPVEKAAAFFTDLPIYPFSSAETAAITDPVAFIENRAREVQAKHGRTPLVILDYLQDLARLGDEQTRHEVSAISKAFRLMATRNRWFVLTISSTSRANHLKSGAKISLEWIDYVTVGKESGDLEHDFATQMFLVTLPKEDPSEVQQDGFIMVSKVRGGDKGPVGVTFRGDTGQFIESTAALKRLAKKQKTGGADDAELHTAIIRAIKDAGMPLNKKELRERTGVRAATLQEAINAMLAARTLRHSSRPYQGRGPKPEVFAAGNGTLFGDGEAA